MNDKKPFWKNGVLYVWSDYYNHYIANHCPLHFFMIGFGLSFDEYKEMVGLDYKVINDD